MESVRALEQQAGVLDELRSRTGVLLAAAAIVTSFLGAAVLDASDFDTLAGLALIAFVAVIIGAVASEIDVVLDNFAAVALATLTLNVAAMSVSFAVARLARLSTGQATAIAMELGIHNSTLAIAVAGTINIDYAIPAAVYSGFMFITAGLFARFMRKRNAAALGAPADALFEVP